MPVAALDPDRAGGEPGRPAGVLALHPRPAHPAALTGAGAGGVPVAQCCRQVRQAGVERLLGAFRPPWRHPLLDLVPGAAQVRQGPALPRRQIRLGHPVGGLRGALCLHRADPPQHVVVREPGRAGVAAQATDLHVGGVEGEPVRLHDPTGRWLVPLHDGSSAAVAAATARPARSAPARRPYSRAQRLVRISVTSRTRSSSTPAGSAGSTTNSRRPCTASAASAASAASTYSAPNRANRSRCSTTIVVASGSRSSPRNFLHRPFNAEPTSVTTSETTMFCPVTHAVTRATCRSRSAR